MISFKLLFADKLVQSLCWTLVHSLWLGLVIAVMAGVIIIGTRKSTPLLRYNLLALTLVLFLSAMCFIFFRQWNNGISTETQILQSRQPAQMDKALNTFVTSDATSNRIYGIITFLNEHASTIVLVWMLIMAIRSVSLIRGLYGIHQLARRQLSTPGEYWIQRITGLSMELGIRQRVRFFQSGLAKVPVVLGHIKPVILFPIGLLASIPPSEVEAILLHELAHIRRRDYLVNMLQNLVEIFFFFNPAILWISALVRQERENCCDDLAISRTNNKRNYINALLSFQEFNLANQPLATALTGRKHSLLQRVKRIIYSHNPTLNAMEKITLVVSIAVIGFFALAFSPHLGQKDQKPVSTYLSNLAQKSFLNRAATDTVPVQNENTENPILENRKMKLAEMAKKEQALRLEALKAELIKLESEKSTRMTDLLKQEEELAINRKAELANLESLKAQLKLERSVEMQKEVNADLEKKILAQSQLARQRVEQLMIQYQEQKQIAIQLREEAEKSMMNAKIAQQEQQGNITNDLISEKIITDPDDFFSFLLNEREMIVNDIKQPSKIHKKFRDKYGKGSGWNISFKK